MKTIYLGLGRQPGRFWAEVLANMKRKKKRKKRKKEKWGGVAAVRGGRGTQKRTEKERNPDKGKIRAKGRGVGRRTLLTQAKPSPISS